MCAREGSRAAPRATMVTAAGQIPQAINQITPVLLGVDRFSWQTIRRPRDLTVMVTGIFRRGRHFVKVWGFKTVLTHPASRTARFVIPKRSARGVMHRELTMCVHDSMDMLRPTIRARRILEPTVIRGILRQTEFARPLSAMEIFPG